MKREWKTTTAEALLGLLSAIPRSGYELKRFIDASIRDFWTESFSLNYGRIEADALLRWADETLATLDGLVPEAYPGENLS